MKKRMLIMVFAALVLLTSCDLEDDNRTVENSKKPTSNADSIAENATLHGSRNDQATAESNEQLSEISKEYKAKALIVAANELRRMKIPVDTRSPVLESVEVNGEVRLEVRYSPPSSTSRAGDWLLYFNPDVPMEENPIDVKIFR